MSLRSDVPASRRLRVASGRQLLAFILFGTLVGSVLRSETKDTVRYLRPEACPLLKGAQ